MSWDISIQDLPAGALTVADIPNDFQPKPLGPRSEVIARIQHILPDTDFKNPDWGILDGDGFSIEFNMGAGEICDGFMLHVRGGRNAMTTVARLLEQLKIRGFDLQTGDFFKLETAEASFAQWQSYRDRFLPKKGSDES